MAEEFNNLDDVLKQWMESGPKESDNILNKHVDITVYLKNGSRQLFVDGHIQDLGSRMIITDETGITVFTEAAVLYYEVEPIEDEDD